MTQTTTSSISQCKRCGTCCRRGGPSLHADDKGLLLEGVIRYEHLISIRKGEMAFHPLEDEPAAIPQELVKLKGKGRLWECMFFSESDKSCSIYERRPLECRLLQCWEPSAVESIAGQGTLTRFELIPNDDPILDYILRHEQECPVPEERTFCLASSPRPEGKEALAELTALVCRDLAIRYDAVRRFDIPLPLELFYFGRPIHTMLGAFGLFATDDGVRIGAW
jgi:Fe-S-cluster containining protein